MAERVPGRVLTAGEVQALAPGEIVEVTARIASKKHWRKGTVVRVSLGSAVVSLFGRARNGRRLADVWRDWGHIRWPIDPVPANIYADFLEDHGFPEAAAKLREAFPLSG